jgi:4'-phosphopantetheinyl transferase
MGRLLLSIALENSGLPPSLVHFVKVTDEGRPYLASHKVDFNISHSGDVVVCAFSDEGQLGIDVEEVVEIQFEDFENQFTRREWDEIHQHHTPLTKFYMLWSRKEAVIKADGRGLQNELSMVDVSKNVTMLGEKTWFLLDLPIGDRYKMCLAAERPVASCEVKLEWIQL